MTSLRRITLFTALACILLFGAAHTLVHAQADGSLGANGDCEQNNSACATGFTCESNANSDDTCVATGGYTGSIACGVGSVPAGSSCVSCPNGDNADTAADCPTDGSQTANPGTGGSQTANPGTGGSQTVNTGTGGASLQNPLTATDLPTLLNEVLGYVVGLGTIALTIMLVYVGFLFVAARGNSEKVSQARQMLLYIVIGGLLILGAQGLETVIQSTIQAL
jgi:hypothetical protein